MKSFKQYLHESGLKQALDTGDPKLMQRELAKRRERLERLKADAARLNQLPNFKGALAAETKFSQAQALKPGIEDLTMPLETMGIKTGVKLRELPTEKPWTDGPLPLSPDVSDSPLDDDTTGDTSEVKADAAIRSMGTDPRPAAIRQQAVLRGSRIFPTPSEMASQFFTQERNIK